VNEADTCRRFITPALTRAGWSIDTQISEQVRFTDGRVVPQGRAGRRMPGKRADYVLSYRPDNPLAIVEAKAYEVPAANGLQQAIEYADILGLPFAFATNGRDILWRNLLAGDERRLDEFPSPEVLWQLVVDHAGIDDAAVDVLLTPSFHDASRRLRYYQTLAVNQALARLAQGHEKVLLTLATGTGKSVIAFQICWRLWQAAWNRRGVRGRRPRMLYLADRGVLIDQPMLQHFAPFGDSMKKVDRATTLGREMYFATYQQIAEDERRPGLYREYPPDFFDLVIIDECHRGSARDESTWRGILDHFTGAAKLGMTATPFREETRDTYQYFGDPVVEYSLAQGIDDGFLAPYRVRRVITDVDAAGWRPERGEVDRHGQAIPDDLYGTTDFERAVSLTRRTGVMAQWLTDYLQHTSPLDKTIVFCVDQEHAQQMRDELARRNPDMVRQYPDWVCRVTADEGPVGRNHLDNFQDIDRSTPAILTTSEMLTTGVDAPTTINVVLCRVVNSMAEFKQIIGRGTRLRTDYGKWFFTIVDFTGTATQKFADPAFDGEPIDETHDTIDRPPKSGHDDRPHDVDDDDTTRSAYRKFYVDGVEVRVVADLAYELDAEGQKLRTVQYTDYAGERVRTICRSDEDLRSRWADPRIRSELLDELEARGVDLDYLAEQSGATDADAFDLLCHVAYAGPLRTRRERARSIRKANAGQGDFWDRFSPAAQEVLSALLDRYEQHGVLEIQLPQVLDLPPLSDLGSVIELSQRFGGPNEMQAAVRELQQRLYAI
jgi:type I restriction enzyme, R subunit